EFHALVAVEPVIGDGSMGKRFFEQIRIVELISEKLFSALVQIICHKNTCWNGRADRTALWPSASEGRGMRISMIGKRFAWANDQRNLNSAQPDGTMPAAQLSEG